MATKSSGFPPEKVSPSEFFGLEILFEDNHLLVVDKAPGIAVQGARAGEPSVFLAAGAYLKRKYQKPGNVFVGVVHRLDKPVGGVLVLARTSKAAARLAAQFAGRTVEKTYQARVEGTPPREGALRHFLRAGEKSMIADKDDKKGGQEARLRFRRIDAGASGSLLEIELETGRKHQIRCQLAAAGFPILGDQRYGSSRPWPEGIALLCQRLTFQHPVDKELELSFETQRRLGWGS